MAKRPDYILLGTVASLMIVGILILANVSAPLSLERFGTTYYFLNHQLLLGFLPGIILGFLAFRVPLSFLKKWAPILLLLNLVLLAIIFLPGVGSRLGGAARWINLGPLSFQPSEPLKLIFILYLATWLTSRMDTRKTDQGYLKRLHGQTFLVFSIVIVIISSLLILQPDISTLGVIILVAISMYFLAKMPLWQSFLMILAGTGALFVLVKIAPYRLNRFLVLFDPTKDLMGIGYQLKQAVIAVGSGGISGLGMGMSYFKFGFLPQTISDSIFAVFAEETGFIGSCFLILLFLIFLWRGLRIGKLCQDSFSQLTAWGITIWICLQGFINIAAMIGIFPLTGIPLPFISYGGSALVVQLMGIGVLLNISRQKTQ
ncbi:MAG TPA: putative peptidoglycan glycosyltransferase FtsW [Candidatus Humimicrobiaceae bacterium]|nr:putative peptidoglycan glycosyltransferase FtsW [Candidatus Humimicrobiaceae bacterium]